MSLKEKQQNKTSKVILWCVCGNKVSIIKEGFSLYFSGIRWCMKYSLILATWKNVFFEGGGQRVTKMWGDVKAWLVRGHGRYEWFPWRPGRCGCCLQIGIWKRGAGGGVTIEGRDGNQWMSIVKTGFWTPRSEYTLKGSRVSCMLLMITNCYQLGCGGMADVSPA